MNEVWDDDEAPFDSPEEFAEFVNLALRHWNSVSDALEDSKEVYLPWLDILDGEESPRGNNWARGFLRGMEMCWDSWAELEKDEDKFGLLIPVLAFAHENDPDPEMRPWETPPDGEKRLEMLATLAATTQFLYNHFRPHWMRAARRQGAGTNIARPKIGRNDPCYCGSGKKYKRCCGNATVH